MSIQATNPQHTQHLSLSWSGSFASDPSLFQIIPSVSISPQSNDLKGRVTTYSGTASPIIPQLAIDILGTSSSGASESNTPPTQSLAKTEIPSNLRDAEKSTHNQDVTNNNPPA